MRTKVLASVVQGIESNWIRLDAEDGSWHTEMLRPDQTRKLADCWNFIEENGGDVGKLWELVRLVRVGRNALKGDGFTSLYEAYQALLGEEESDE